MQTKTKKQASSRFKKRILLKSAMQRIFDFVYQRAEENSTCAIVEIISRCQNSLKFYVSYVN
jgi:hypothetical protein